MQQAFTLEVDPQGRVILKRPDEADVVDARIRRAFPWSQPERFVSIRSSEGKELLLVEDLALLPPATRQVIQSQLDKWAFIPTISRVLKVDVRFGFQQWTVQTDRGEIHFRVQEREDIRFLDNGRFSIKDVDGCLYELPSLTDLDEQSRKAVEVLV